MASQDRRIQENRYRQDEWADDNRRDFSPREGYRGEDARRYQSERQEFQGSPADYGRGREQTYQEGYGRGGEYYGRRDPYGRTPFQEDYGERSRDYFEREPYGRRNLQAYEPQRSFYQGDWSRGQDRDYGRAEFGRAEFGRAEYDDFERDQYNRNARLERQQRPVSERLYEGWSRADEGLRGRGRERDYEDEFGQGQRGNFEGRGPKNYIRANERIRDDVSDRLTDDPYVDASEIEVQVQNGEVTLNGSVENRNQRHRVELIAEQVSGVHHVQNNLRVHAQQHQGQGAAEHPAKEQARAPGAAQK
jgi:hypothetical protein